jgi:hypothetical protein
MSFWYLATSYTKHPGGLEAAYEMAVAATAVLMDAGIRVFSPIVHSHPVSKIIRGTDVGFWLKADAPMMDAAHGMIILRDGNWGDSNGIAKERNRFTEACKPIVYMDPGVVPVFSP